MIFTFVSHCKSLNFILDFIKGLDQCFLLIVMRGESERGHVDVDVGVV